MKKSELKSLIRECVSEVLSEAKKAPKERKPGDVWGDGGGTNAMNRNGVKRRFVAADQKEKAKKWAADSSTQPKKRAKSSMKTYNSPGGGTYRSKEGPINDAKLPKADVTVTLSKRNREYEPNFGSNLTGVQGFKKWQKENPNGPKLPSADIKESLPKNPGMSAKDRAMGRATSYETEKGSGVTRKQYDAASRYLKKSSKNETAPTGRKVEFVLAHTGNGGRTEYDLLQRVGQGPTDWKHLEYFGGMDSTRRMEAVKKYLKDKFGKTVTKWHSSGPDGDDWTLYTEAKKPVAPKTTTKKSEAPKAPKTVEKKPLARKKVTMKDNPKQGWGYVNHPETGKPAPKGQFWALNIMSRKWYLVHDGERYTTTPSSETYWSS